MAEWTDFSERQFEFAFLDELAVPGTAPFVPSTTAEKRHGFDVALPMTSPGLWPAVVAAILAPYPNRTSSDPPLLSAASLFLQFKVPFHLKTLAATQGPVRQASCPGGLGAPFFRVSLSTDQHATFRQLENAVAPHGVARYAAPQFRTWIDMTALQIARSVAARTVFVSPVAMGPSETWTYEDWGMPHCRMRHSEPEIVQSESIEELELVLQEAQQGVARGSLSHVQDLADAVRDADFVAFQDWVDESVPILAEQIASLEVTRRYEDIEAAARDLLTVAAASEEAGADWFLFAHWDE